MRDIVILDKKQILCICFHVMWIVWLIQQSPQIVHTFEATFVILAFTCMPSLWPQRWNSCLIQVKVMTNTCPTIVLINIFSFLFSYPINIVASICGWIILQSLHFCFSLTTTKKLLPVSYCKRLSPLTVLVGEYIWEKGKSGDCISWWFSLGCWNGPHHSEIWIL